MTGTLAQYDEARRALEAARSLPEVREIRDKAEAMRVYARQAQDSDLMWWAAEIKLRAERRAGDLLVEMAASGKRSKGGRSKGGKKESQRAILSELGVTIHQSSRWQQAAALPEAEFEAWLAALRERPEAIPTSSALRNLVKIRAAQSERAPRRRNTVKDLAALADRVEASGKRFGFILADPPWEYRSRSEAGQGRSAKMHYRTMSLEEICALGPLVRKLAAKACGFGLWVTWPHLFEASAVIEAFGFRYSTCGFDWAKRTPSGKGWHSGNGNWTRANTEPCLLAFKGAPLRLARDVNMLVVAPRCRHSEKPAEVHARIERLIPGPYLELFGRAPRKGWTVWSNEVSPGEVTT